MNRPPTDDELEQVLRAGDIMAEILGRSVAAHDAKVRWPARKVKASRDAILAWHRVKTIAER